MLRRGLSGSILMLLGGLGVSSLPASTPLLRWGWLASARATDVGRGAGEVLVLAGLVLLGSAWWSLLGAVGSEPDGEGEPGGDGGGGALRLARRAAVVWSVPLLVAPPLLSADGWSYAAQGTLLHTGVSPYEHGTRLLSGPILEAVDPRWLDTITPYGPLPLWLGSLAAGVTSDPWLLVLFHRALAAVGLLLLAWAVPRLARWTGANPAWATAVVIASPLMLGSGLGGLHNDLLQVGLMAAALAVAAPYVPDHQPARRGLPGWAPGWVAGAVLAGLAAATKAPGGVVCLGIVLVSLPPAASLGARLLRLASVAAVSLATLFGLGLVTGVGHGWLRALTVPGSVPTPLSLTTMAGRALGLGHAGLTDTTVDVVRQVGTVLTVLVLAWVALRWRTGDRAGALRATALAVGVLVALSPAVQPWYLLWIVPFVAVLRLSRLAAAALVLFTLVASIDAALAHAAYYALGIAGLVLGYALAALQTTEAGRRRSAHLAAVAPLPGEARLGRAAVEPRVGDPAR